MSGLINTPEHVLVWNACIGVLYEWATDCDGRKIKKSDHGQYTEYGWHIDHIVPLTLGGSEGHPRSFTNPRRPISRRLAI